MRDDIGTTAMGDHRLVLGRRTLLGAAGVAAGVSAMAPRHGLAAVAEAEGASPDLTGRLARYMVSARDLPLPAPVVEAAKHRILDTLAAIVSGATLPAGEIAAAYAKAEGGTPEATVLVSGVRTTRTNAAFANGMSAHADESDDFEPVTKAHPGCAVVPAALAFAEAEDRSGAELIAAVTLGYDLSCRLLMALDPDLVRATHRSAEGTGATFGAVGAAASLARFDEAKMRYALSYAAQQTSGLWSWQRDKDHVEKAFDFSGMGSRNGAAAASMVQAGFTGVWDVLDGDHNLIAALSTNPRPEQMVAGLGSRFFITETAIKPFTVGYPIQAPLDALLTLRRQHGLRPDMVRAIVVRLPPDGARIVTDSSMPDVNVQHLMGVALIDGTVSFEMSHSHERMRDPAVIAVRKKVTVIADPALRDPKAPRSGLVEVALNDGRTVKHFTRFPPGTKENPLATAQVNEKARTLIAPVIGADKADAVIAAVGTLETQKSIRPLVALMQVAAERRH